MMRTAAVVLMLALALLNFPKSLQAQTDRMGIGVIIGEPTGVCAVNQINEFNSLSLAAAWSISDRSSLHFHLDDLFHRDDLLALPFYYGGGIRVLLVENGDDPDDRRKTRLGIRLPLGIIYQFDVRPVDMFFELVPIFDLLPGTDFDLNAAVGVRYYFD